MTYTTQYMNHLIAELLTGANDWQLTRFLLPITSSVIGCYALCILNGTVNDPKISR